MLKNHIEGIIYLEFSPHVKTYSKTLVIEQTLVTLAFDRLQGIEHRLE